MGKSSRLGERLSCFLNPYEAAKKRMDAIANEKQARVAKRENISRFLADLQQRDGIIEIFDEELWYATVDMVTVHSTGDLTFTFKNGTEIKIQEQEYDK